MITSIQDIKKLYKHGKYKASEAFGGIISTKMITNYGMTMAYSHLL